MCKKQSLNAQKWEGDRDIGICLEVYGAVLPGYEW